MGPKTILVRPEDYGEIDIDETQLANFFARPVLSIEQDLELVKKGIKTRKPVQYGHKVIVRR